MARNGDQAADELRRQAVERREAMRRTASALEDRLREKKHQVEEAIDRTRDKLHGADQLVHRYRYAIIGGAVGLGFVLGRRRSSDPVVGAANGTRYVLVEQQARPGVLRSIAGGLAALALRQGVAWAMRSLEESSERDEEPRQFTPPTPKPHI